MMLAAERPTVTWFTYFPAVNLRRDKVELPDGSICSAGKFLENTGIRPKDVSNILYCNRQYDRRIVTTWDEAGELMMPRGDTDGWIKISNLTRYVIRVIETSDWGSDRRNWTLTAYPNKTTEMSDHRREWLKGDRKKAKLSQGKIAYLAGISRSSFSRIERGARVRLATYMKAYYASRYLDWANDMEVIRVLRQWWEEGYPEVAYGASTHPFSGDSRLDVTVRTWIAYGKENEVSLLVKSKGSELGYGTFWNTGWIKERHSPEKFANFLDQNEIRPLPRFLIDRLLLLELLQRQGGVA
ncbi:MAG: helix-turn-helix domain-containing protein [Patescibacteria group bacterium]|nr:helix-turn-helix domain-containing protein [Patescibacteria group bacterium]